MKKLLLGLGLLSSFTAFASCNLFVNIESEGNLERKVISELSLKGYNVVEDQNKASHSLDEIYSFWHGGDGVDGYGSRIKITDLSTGTSKFYVGDYTNYFFGLGMKKNPDQISIQRALVEVENCN